MRLDIDLEADALYITVGGDFARTVELSGWLLVDVTSDGSVCGIEVIGLERGLPIDDVFSRFAVPAQTVAILRALQANWVIPRLQVA